VRGGKVAFQNKSVAIFHFRLTFTPPATLSPFTTQHPPSGESCITNSIAQ
jgi:hypothetical protein